MLSVVIPVLNEEKNIQILHKDIISSLKPYNFEIIFVDDGSTDRSLEILKKLTLKNKKVRLFSFRKNQGKAEALTFGFEKAKGDYVVTLDADLQDKPSEIPKLLKKLKEGYDVVTGWRKDRKDTPIKVFSSRLFNFLVRCLWKLNLHDYNCGLKVYTKEAAKSLRLYGGLHRFIPFLAYEQGFRVAEVVVQHKKRRFGKSKYGISKILRDIPDIFTMIFLSRYAHRPLHFFGAIGAALFLLGFLILTYLSIIWLGGEPIGRRPLLFFGVLLVLSGLQVFFTGFLADLMINLSYKREIEEGDKFLLKYSSE